MPKSAGVISRRAWIGAAAMGLPCLARAGLVETVATTRQSVVAVGTYAATDAPRFGFRGTGFVVGDGTLLITNHHVLPSAEAQAAGPAQRSLAVLVPNPGGEPVLRQASLVHSDRNHDLALLRIEGSPLPALTLGPPELAPQGTSIALIGFPIGGVFGFAPVVHRGIVAAISAWRFRHRGPATEPGHRGATAGRAVRDLPAGRDGIPRQQRGPLIEAESGRVIGVINMVLVRSTRESALTNPTGITYAIPVRRVLDLLKSPGG